MSSSLKKLLIAYAVVIHLLVAYLLFKPAPKPTVAELQANYAKLQQEVFLLAGIPEGGTVFLGDSLTAGLNTSAFKPAANFGLPGDTTKGLTERMPEYKLSSAGAIVLMIGTNDREGEADFDSLAQQLPQVPLIWYAIPPIDPTVEKVRSNTRIAEMNGRAERVCAAIVRCTFVTLPLAGPDGGLKYHVGDGVHLNQQGYEIWTRDLQQRLAAIRNEPVRY